MGQSCNGLWGLQRKDLCIYVLLTVLKVALRNLRLAPEAAIAKRESATSPLFAGHYPSSKVVTPNPRSSRNGGIAPVYIRAVSNTGTSPRSCANATASRLMLGTSRKISPPPTLASKADRTTSAVARSSATSGPILQPLRHGRITPQPTSLPSRTRAQPTCPGEPIQARRNAGRGAGTTVASYPSTAANGTSVSAMTPASGASGAATMPP